MTIAAPIIEHGERYGKLTVLRRVTKRNRGPRYICGCECGYPRVKASARQLIKGLVTACQKCSDRSP